MKFLFPGIRYVVVLLAAVCVASFFQTPFVHLYKYVFPNEMGGGLDIDFTGVVVISYAMEFLIPFLILTLGDSFRYKVTAVAVILLGILEYFIDPFNFQAPLTLLIFGIILGWAVRLLAAKTLGRVSSLEPYKKYF